MPSKNKIISHKPEWQPETDDDAFAVKIVHGVENQWTEPDTHSATKNHSIKLENIAEKLITGDRTALGRAITLVESNTAHHQQQARELLHSLLPKTGNALRIGISGVPGSGKSTFIEALGTYLYHLGKKIAVLAVDPSSSITKGSILGDKTRMEKLSRLDNTFIRPSPSGGTLGGVARKSRETMMLCEAAGYDVILVETVGVGQNEITVRSMVDVFILVLIAGAGDELQGIKKGIIEIADLILINKADGDNIMAAERAKSGYELALHYLRQNIYGWRVPVLLCSALEQRGIDSVWIKTSELIDLLKDEHLFEKQRHEQLLSWTKDMLEERILHYFYKDLDVNKLLSASLNQVSEGEILPTQAVNTIFDSIFPLLKKNQ